MFHSLSLCPVNHLFAPSGPAGRALLAAAVGLGVSVAALGIGRWPAVDPSPSAAPMILQADSARALRDAAEAMRARILAGPGGMQVELAGLNQTRLWVEYSTRRLALAGLTEADLRAALPVDLDVSGPGHLALRGNAALGFQAVADLRVRGARLGDVAMVVRERLEPPVATMRVEGRPAVEIVVKS